MSVNYTKKLLLFGNELLTGIGDPIYAGWVNRVMTRTFISKEEDEELEKQKKQIYFESLSVPNETLSHLSKTWEAEFDERCDENTDNYVVFALGDEDINHYSNVRSKLNLAKTLDRAVQKKVKPFVVGPIPSHPMRNEEVKELSDIYKDAATRRNIIYVDLFNLLYGNEKWNADLRKNNYEYPGQVGYEMISWLVLNAGWKEWLLG